MIYGSNISIQSFKRKVGSGSKRHDFVGEFLMIFSSSFSEEIQPNAPEIVVILNYVEFMRGTIKKTLTGNNNVQCNYHIRSDFCSRVAVLIKPYLFSYRNLQWGRHIPLMREFFLFLNFQEWVEFITV